MASVGASVDFTAGSPEQSSLLSLLSAGTPQWIVEEHNYCKPYVQQCKSTAQVTQYLFMKPPKQTSDTSFGVVDVVEELPRTTPLIYDVTKAHNLMTECERHLGIVRLQPVPENWDECLDKSEWSISQHKLFGKVVGILEDDVAAKLALHQSDNEAVLQRLHTDRTARRIRLSLATVQWDCHLTQWLHCTLVDNISDALLVSYLNALQTLRVTVPLPLIDQMMAPHTQQLMEAANQALQLLLKRPWDPVANTLSVPKLRKLPQHPVFIMCPTRPYTHRARLRHWHHSLGALGKVYIVNPTTAGAPRQFLLHLLSAVKAKILEIRAQNSARPIILVGWHVTSLLVCEVSLLDHVSGVVCLGLPLQSLEGLHGQAEDKLMGVSVPLYIVIGQRSSTADIQEVEEFREQLKTSARLLVIGGADDYLRMSSRQKMSLGVTQLMVDRCIQEDLCSWVTSLFNQPKTDVAVAKTKYKKSQKKAPIQDLPQPQDTSVSTAETTSLSTAAATILALTKTTPSKRKATTTEPEASKKRPKVTDVARPPSTGSSTGSSNTPLDISQLTPAQVWQIHQAIQFTLGQNSQPEASSSLSNHRLSSIASSLQERLRGHPPTGVGTSPRSSGQNSPRQITAPEGPAPNISSKNAVPTVLTAPTAHMSGYHVPGSVSSISHMGGSVSSTTHMGESVSSATHMARSVSSISHMGGSVGSISHVAGSVGSISHMGGSVGSATHMSGFAGSTIHMSGSVSSTTRMSGLSSPATHVGSLGLATQVGDYISFARSITPISSGTPIHSISSVAPVSSVTPISGSGLAKYLSSLVSSAPKPVVNMGLFSVPSPLAALSTSQRLTSGLSVTPIMTPVPLGGLTTAHNAPSSTQAIHNALRSTQANHNALHSTQASAGLTATNTLYRSTVSATPSAIELCLQSRPTTPYTSTLPPMFFPPQNVDKHPFGSVLLPQPQTNPRSAALISSIVDPAVAPGHTAPHSVTGINLPSPRLAVPPPRPIPWASTSLAQLLRTDRLTTYIQGQMRTAGTTAYLSMTSGASSHAIPSALIPRPILSTCFTPPPPRPGRDPYT